MNYDKLVRDKIPQIVKKKGKVAYTHVAYDEEYWQKLRDKLVEEVNEFNKEGKVEELADVIEVINAICKYRKINKKQLEKMRIKKAKERGGFSKRIILDEVVGK